MPSPAGASFSLNVERTGAALLALLLGACGAGEQATTVTAIRDSAGITIVENVSPVWTEATRWRVAPEPEVEIGVLEGEEAYQLIQVSGATVLSDGRILIVDGGSAQLRYYDAAGRHLMSGGGHGAGPGELDLPVGPHRFAGDSVLVRPNRISPDLAIFDEGGRFVRSINGSGARLLGEVLGVLPGGDILRLSTLDLYALVAEAGYIRVETAVERHSREGALLDTLTVLPGDEYYRSSETSAGRVSARFVPPPFAHFQQVVLAGDMVYAGTGEAFEIEVYRTDTVMPEDSGEGSGGGGDDVSGTTRGSRPTRLIRLARTNRPVTGGDIEEFRRFRFSQAQTANARRSVERYLVAATFPKEMPVFRDLRVDAGGNLWVEEYRAPWEEEVTPRWEIFASDGVWLGTVETPAGLQIYEIGENYLLGRWKDELGVEYVRRHRLH